MHYAVERLFTDVGDYDLMKRMMVSDEFLDGFLSIIEDISI